MEANSEFSDPCAILILVTGLPAAGKSSFLHAAQRYAREQPQRTFPLFGGCRHGRIAAVLQLDDLLLNASREKRKEDSSPQAAQESTDQEVFSPARWRWATQQLLQLTEAALVECLPHSSINDKAAESIVTALPLVFVEDNMHLRSMRERYHVMCRRLEEKLLTVKDERQIAEPKGAADGFIGILELRFFVPLPVCLERNARRTQLASRGGIRASALNIPSHVIVSMHAVFDRCWDETAQQSSTEGRTSSACRALWWRWTPSTQPWCLLELNSDLTPSRTLCDAGANRTATSLPTSDELATEFFTIILQESAHEALRAQHERVLLRRERRRQAEAADLLSCEGAKVACVQSHSHELDLQLRAVAHAFIAEKSNLSASEAAAFGKASAKLKKRALQRFKDEIRLGGTAVRGASQAGVDSGESDTIAEVHEACLLEYQQALGSLWQSKA